jgi:hypothetical protein
MTYPEITFRDFQRLMAKRRRTVDELVDIFRGKLDDSRSFFERAMSCQWRNPDTGRFDDRSDVVIPYKSVIEFYFKETQYLKDTPRGAGEARHQTQARACERRTKTVSYQAIRKGQGCQVCGAQN